MKKIYLIGFMCLLLTGCISEEEMKQRGKMLEDTEGIFDKVTEVTYKNHSYLYFNNTGSSKIHGFVHDPDCQCHKAPENDFGF